VKLLSNDLQCYVYYKSLFSTGRDGRDGTNGAKGEKGDTGLRGLNGNAGAKVDRTVFETENLSFVRLVHC